MGLSRWLGISVGCTDEAVTSAAVERNNSASKGSVSHLICGKPYDGGSKKRKFPDIYQGRGMYRCYHYAMPPDKPASVSYAGRRGILIQLLQIMLSSILSRPMTDVSIKC